MDKATNKNASPQPPLRDKKGNEDHLGYLLTAYVFENISTAGKAEVEAHLKTCAACREQLELLRLTLGLTEEALSEPGKDYVFEERRRQRVLEAAQRSRHSFLHRLDRPAFSFRDWRAAAIAAVAALVALLLVVPLFLTGSRETRFQTVYEKENSQQGRFDNAPDVMNSTDYGRNGAVEFNAPESTSGGVAPTVDYTTPVKPPVGNAMTDSKNPSSDMQGLTAEERRERTTSLIVNSMDEARTSAVTLRRSTKVDLSKLGDDPRGTIAEGETKGEPAKPAETTAYFAMPESNQPVPSQPQTAPAAPAAVDAPAKNFYREGTKWDDGEPRGWQRGTAGEDITRFSAPRTKTPLASITPNRNDSLYLDYPKEEAAAEKTIISDLVQTWGKSAAPKESAPLGAPKEPALVAGGGGTDGPVALGDAIGKGKPASAGTGEGWGTGAGGGQGADTGKSEGKFIKRIARSDASDGTTKAEPKAPDVAYVPGVHKAPEILTYSTTGQTQPVDNIRMFSNGTVSGADKFGTDNSGGLGFGAQTTEELRRQNAQMEAQLTRDQIARQQGQGGVTAFSSTPKSDLRSGGVNLGSPGVSGLSPQAGGAPAGTTASDSRDQAGAKDLAGLKLNFNNARDRELQLQTELSTVKNTRDLQREAAAAPAGPDILSGRAATADEKRKAAEEKVAQIIKNADDLISKNGPEGIEPVEAKAAITDEKEVRRYKEGLENLRGVVIKQQQAVVVEKDGQSSPEKAQLENELNTLKQHYAALEKDKAEVEKDLSRQTARIQSMIEKGVPVYTLLNEDASATQPPINPDPATAAARTGPEAKAKAEEILQQLTQESGREKVAIAAKDETIRRQEELLAKEKAEKDSLYGANQALAAQNEALAKQNTDGRNWAFNPGSIDTGKIPVAIDRLKNLNYFNDDVRITPEPDGTVSRLSDLEAKKRALDDALKAAESNATRGTIRDFTTVDLDKLDLSLSAKGDSEKTLKEALSKIEAVSRDKVALESLKAAKPESAAGAVAGRYIVTETPDTAKLDAEVAAARAKLPEQALQQLEQLKQSFDTSTEEGRLAAQVDKLNDQLDDLRRVDRQQRGEEVDEELQEALQQQQASKAELQNEFAEKSRELTELKRKIVRQSQQGEQTNTLALSSKEKAEMFDAVPPDSAPRFGEEKPVQLGLRGWKEANGKESERGRIASERLAVDALAAQQKAEDSIHAGTGSANRNEDGYIGEGKSKEEIAHLRREQAAQESLAARERETEQFKTRVGKMLKQVEEFNARGDHKAAENLAVQVLKVDPLNAEAEGWKHKARGAAHKAGQTDIKTQHQQEYREAMLNVDEASLSNGPLLAYPENWDQISKEPSANRVAGINEERKKLAESEYKHHFERSRERADRNEDAYIRDNASNVELNILDVRNLAAVQDFPGPRVGTPTPITLLSPRLDPQFPNGSDSKTSPLIGSAESLVTDIKTRFADDFADPATAIEESGGKLVIMATPETQQKVKDYIGTLRPAEAGSVITAPLITQKSDAGVANAPAGFRRQFYSKAFGSPTLVQGQQLNLLRANPHSSALGVAIQNPLGDSERTLRAFNYLRDQSADAKSVTLGDFLKRPAPVPAPILSDEGLDEDAYIEKYGTRPFVDARRDKLSTFSMDVDTASYTLARSRLNANELPDPATVRVEEFVNYFKQPYKVEGTEAFAVFAEAAPSPFGRASSLASNYVELAAQQPLQVLKIGIKSRDPKEGERKPAQLTFAIDTSGSMTKDDRLTLVRGALKNLVESLKPEDSLAIVTFADQAQVALPRTQARQKQRILDAIDALNSNGGTSVEAGLNLAYRLADESFSPDAVNRVILCSDGVANIGAQGPAARSMPRSAKTLTVFNIAAVGFGNGQYNDEMLVKLANNGNGSCHFVDSADEARRVFSEQLPPNLSALARDAKVQVEFNPETVSKYRLLGYEKRKIADKDFRNDKIDAGEVQHSTLVTALYEIERVPATRGSLGKVFLRWKDAGHRHLPVVERNFPLDENIQSSTIEGAPIQLRFLACVARFAELLRDSKWVQNSSYADVLDQLNALPQETRNREDVKEVKMLVEKAQKLSIEKWTRSFSP